jgi:nitroreductase
MLQWKKRLIRKNHNSRSENGPPLKNHTRLRGNLKRMPSASRKSPLTYSQPVTEIIRRRFSCRNYDSRPIEEKDRRTLEEFMAALTAGPLGSALRFQLLAATDPDRDSLRGLETYGFIRNETGFIAGAATRSNKYLEDYGCALERIILLATDLGLGSCWLGGTFNKSGFAKKISLRKGEDLPAVAAIGYIADPERARSGILARAAGADRRLPWESLFFREEFGVPLSISDAGAYAEPLEMVHLGPSASNKQPWRILRRGKAWHFYLQRTKGYRAGFFQTLLRVADIQRVDMGIAMCHFELTASEAGVRGKWAVDPPTVAPPDREPEYIVTWLEQE